jgi:hypothetical protein
MMQKFEMPMMGELILPWVPSEATQGRHLHLSNEVHSGSSQEVWDEGRQAREDTNGY